MPERLKQYSGRFPMFCWITFLLTVSSVVSGSVRTDPINQFRVEITDYGIYELQVRKIVKYDPTNTAGYRSRVKSVKDIVLIEQTENIPLVKGTVFGFRMRFHGVPEGENFVADLRYTHPPIIGKDGKVSTGFTNKNGRLKPVEGKYEGGTLYQFSEDYELVPGKWVFDVVYKGKVVATKTFNVYE